MAITSQQAVNWSDRNARIIATLMAQLYNFAVPVLADWNSGVSALFPNTAAILQDGAAPDGLTDTNGDGRKVITGAMVNNIINRCTEITSASATTGLAMGVVAVKNTILQVAVSTTR